MLDQHAPSRRKNGEILHSLSKGKHTGQTKHDFQNVLGCVRLSDLVKTPLIKTKEQRSSCQARGNPK